MVAIIFMIGTKYACNVSIDWDLICLQSQTRTGLYMQACLVPYVTKISSIFGRSHQTYCNHMWSISICLRYTVYQEVRSIMPKYIQHWNEYERVREKF